MSFIREETLHVIAFNYVKIRKWELFSSRGGVRRVFLNYDPEESSSNAQMLLFEDLDLRPPDAQPDPA